MRFDYQEQDTSMTLREGLAELRSKLDLIEGGQEFEDHDVLHIVYGLDVSLNSEVKLDAITLFGTTAGWGQYLALLKRPEVPQLLREIGWRKLLWITLTGWPAALLALLRSLRQPARWPYTDYQRYWDVPLGAIRREYGIRAQHAVAGQRASAGV